MADDVDVASGYQEVLLNATLANRVIYEGVSAEGCEKCDTPIPQARRLAIPGCTLCAFCKGKEERNKPGRR